MARRRPKGVIELGWACLESSVTGRTEHVPTSVLYSEDIVTRTTIQAGGGHGWRISALTTPRAKPAPWKIVVVTGAPSWAEYWAPTLAALPQDREMIVVDRPGFAGSEPVEYVGDIRVQAAALAPLLDAKPGQKVLLVGQSYGAAIASLMAAARPKSLKGLVLLSGYFGEYGPTAKWLVEWGSKLLAFIPRDLKNAVREVSGQSSQLEHLHAALERITVPVHILHGTEDDFAPLETAERLFKRIADRKGMKANFVQVAGANHFLNDGPPEELLALLEACLPVAPKLELPKMAQLSLWWRTRQSDLKDALTFRAPRWRRGNAASSDPERGLGPSPVAGVEAA